MTDSSTDPADPADAGNDTGNDALVGLIVADVPVAIRRLFNAQASRSSFVKWRDGVRGPDGETHRLRILHIEGQGPSVVPSELREFLIRIGKET